MEDFYRVKRVKYKDRNTAICLQNENGPCPLLAIGNLLVHSLSEAESCISQLFVVESEHRYPRRYFLHILSTVGRAFNRLFISDTK